MTAWKAASFVIDSVVVVPVFVLVWRAIWIRHRGISGLVAPFLIIVWIASLVDAYTGNSMGDLATTFAGALWWAVTFGAMALAPLVSWLLARRYLGGPFRVMVAACGICFWLSFVWINGAVTVWDVARICSFPGHLTAPSTCEFGT